MSPKKRKTVIVNATRVCVNEGEGTMMKRYFQEFDGIEDVRSRFAIQDHEIQDHEILLAWYGYGSYCGSAGVLFHRDGKLYEVTGSHCSCYGLEGSWSPGETSWEALAMRSASWGPAGSGEYDDTGREAAKAFEVLVHTHVPRA